MNLNPSVLDVLAIKIDYNIIFYILVFALYVFFYLKNRKNNEKDYPIHKILLFFIALLCMLWAFLSLAGDYIINSMALYMIRLMVLAELVPPLLILSLPKIQLQGFIKQIASVIFDPWVAIFIWTAVIVFWNIPAGFNVSIVSNTANSLLPIFYLVSGVMVWGVVLSPFDKERSLKTRGLFGFIAAVPMMLVAVFWIAAREVLYQPYVGAVCLWNLTPLQNQQISGWIMMIAGIPAMALAIFQIFAWILKEADGKKIA